MRDEDRRVVRATIQIAAIDAGRRAMFQAVHARSEVRAEARAAVEPRSGPHQRSGPRGSAIDESLVADRPVDLDANPGSEPGSGPSRGTAIKSSVVVDYYRSPV